MEKTISRLQIALKWMVVLLILKVTITIVLNYVQYIPPNFQSDFLVGRERYFFGVYSVAFYAHILASPLTIVSGLVLLNRHLRAARPQLHRRLGQVHLLVVLFLVVPSCLVNVETCPQRLDGRYRIRRIVAAHRIVRRVGLAIGHATKIPAASTLGHAIVLDALLGHHPSLDHRAGHRFGCDQHS